MPLMLAGTGESGLAVVGWKATEKETFSGEPLKSVAPLWRGVARGDFPQVLRATLFGFGENEATAPDRVEQLNRELDERGIRVIVAVGSKPLAVTSPDLHGDPKKFIGSCIRTGNRVVIPIETPATGGRKYRSYMWTQEMARFVRRGYLLAQGQGNWFRFPAGAIGEGDNVRDVLKVMLAEGLPIGVDLETIGEHPNARITAIGLANKNRGVSIPWITYESKKHGTVRGLQSEEIRNLALALISSHLPKLFHNGAYDLNVFRGNGIDVGGEWHDTMLAHRAAFSDLYHNLGFVAAHEFAIEPWKIIFDVVRKRNKEKDWADIYQPALLQYNFEDASILPHLWERHQRHLTATPGGWGLYNRLKELAEWGADASFHGMALDEEGVEKEAKAGEARIQAIVDTWNNEIADPKIPLSGKGSKAARLHFFFKCLKAPVLSYSGKGAPQLNGANLLDYDNGSDERLAEAAWTYFRFTKAKKSYDAFIKPFKAAKGRVYARPNVGGTKGTRMSYSEPNLQQVSKAKELKRLRTGENCELAPNLRHLFRADPGHVLMELDYNALEARLVAYAANIPEWLAWLDDPTQDMHINNAKLMYNRVITKKDPLRQIVKTLTYARFYNSKKTVGQVLKALKPSMPSLTEADLVKVFDLFDKGRPEILAWQESVEKFVRQHGYVETQILQVRQLHDKKFPDLNQALSFGIQSTAGNLANGALLRANSAMRALGGRILIQVHDAFIFQAPPETAWAVYNVMKSEMERPVTVWGHENVVFPVEGGWGDSWKSAKKPFEEMQQWQKS